MDPDDYMLCTICNRASYMAVPSHYDPSNECSVLCCWECTHHHAWKLEARGLIALKEWMEQCSSKGPRFGSYDDWNDGKAEEKTQPGGWGIIPPFTVPVQKKP